MQWQTGIMILAVFASTDPSNAWIYFRNSLGVVGWRRIHPQTSDGVSNVLQVARTAFEGKLTVSCMITNAGEIVAIQTF